MPVKPLPSALVKRLRALYNRELAKNRSPDRVYRLLGRMKNIDYRQSLAGRRKIPLESTEEWGRRVRQMNVSRNFPGIELVLKRTHGISAKSTITQIKWVVKEHNQEYGRKEKRYALLEPHAYAIGERIIAMAKTDFPSVVELIGDYAERSKTKRGQDFFKKLKEQHGITEKQLKTVVYGISGIVSRTKINPYNLLLVGYKNGKFIFMPLLDVE